MAKSKSQEIQPTDVMNNNNNNNHQSHIVNLRSMTSGTSRNPSSVRSFRMKRRSYFVLFILSTFTTLLNIIYHMFLFITTISAFPLLLFALFVARLLQFIRRGDGYDKAVKLKSLIRAWIRIGMWLLLVATIVVLIILSIIKHGTNIKHVVNIDLDVLIIWTKIICVISGIYFLVFSLTGFLYLLPRIPLEHNESGINVPEAISEIIECIIFLLVMSEVIKHASIDARNRIHGLHLKKWVEVPVYILMLHDFLTLSTHMIAWSIRRLANQHLKPGLDTKSYWYTFVEELLLRNYLVYYAIGTRKSISFILSSIMVLLVWVLYIGSSLNHRNVDQEINVWEFGKWTCFSLVTCSLLWLIKTCVLLSWEACAIYNRLKRKILEAGEVLYLLGVLGRRDYDIFNLLYEDGCEKDNATDEMNTQLDEENRSFDRDYDMNNNRKVVQRFQLHLVGLYIVGVLGLVSVEKHKNKSDPEEEFEEGNNSNRRVMMKLSNIQRKIVRKDLLLQQNGIETIYNVQQVAQYILAAKGTLSKEKYISDIMKNFTADEDNREILKDFLNWKSNPKTVTEELTRPTKRYEKEEENDWECLKKHLKNVHHSEEMSFLKIQAWMERAHNKCLQLANTLNSGKEVVDCLNKIISGVIISATFIMWLLLTRLATTKVLVIIASPLLAATFIFGDTCKTLFQGIIFIYVVHPFDVGDLCVIGEKLRVVKTTGVWKTIFSKVDSVGTREEVIYPNSELLNKVVINHKTEFDWEKWDYYNEFDLGYWKGDNTDVEIQLKKAITDHLTGKEEDYKLVPSSHRVAVLMVRDNVKIAVRLNYKIDNSGDIQEWTYIKCLQEKGKVQAQFDLFMHDFVDNFKRGIILDSFTRSLDN